MDSRSRQKRLLEFLITHSEKKIEMKVHHQNPVDAILHPGITHDFPLKIQDV